MICANEEKQHGEAVGGRTGRRDLRCEGRPRRAVPSEERSRRRKEPGGRWIRPREQKVSGGWWEHPGVSQDRGSARRAKEKQSSWIR